MKKFLIFLTSASLAAAFSPTSNPTVPAPSPSPSAFTNELTNAIIPAEEAEASAPGTSATEKSYLQGKIDATNYLVKLIEQNSGWMTNFAAKISLEQTKMEVTEQQIVIYDLFGADPTTQLSQYWQGYEDAIQQTVDLMNSWPNTGGPVPGTGIEYSIHVPNADDTGTEPSAPAASKSVTVPVVNPGFRLAPAALRRTTSQRIQN